MDATLEKQIKALLKKLRKATESFKTVTPADLPDDTTRLKTVELGMYIGQELAIDLDNIDEGLEKFIPLDIG